MSVSERHDELCHGIGHIEGDRFKIRVVGAERDFPGDPAARMGDPNGHRCRGAGGVQLEADADVITGGIDGEIEGERSEIAPDPIQPDVLPR